MTTCVGIKGYDPVLNKEYILMAADSMWNNKGNNRVGFDADKIVFNKNGSMTLSHAGSLLFNTDNYFDKKESDSINNLVSKKYNTIAEIYKDLRRINKSNDNSFILGTSDTDSVCLSLFYKKKFKLFKKKIWTSDKKANSYNSLFIGSGWPAAYGKISSELDSVKRKNEEGYEIKLGDLINLTKGALLEASKIDKFTGGHMDIGVLTNSGYVGVKKIHDLVKGGDYGYSREEIVKKLKKDLNTSRNSLDKILLRI